MSRPLATLVVLVAATVAPATALADPGQIGAGARTTIAAEGFGDGIPAGFGDFWDEEVAGTDGVARSTYNWPPPTWTWPFVGSSCPKTGCAAWHSRALGAVDVGRGKLEAYAESSLMTGGFEADNAGYSQTLGRAFLDDKITLSRAATVVLRGRVRGRTWASHSHIGWYGDPDAVLEAEAFFSVRAPPESEVPWQRVGGFQRSYEPTVYGCPYPDSCAVGPGVPAPAPRSINDSFEIEVPLEAGTSFFSAELVADVDMLVWGAKGDEHRTAHAMDALIDSASSLEFEIVVPDDVCAGSASGLLPIDGPKGIAVVKQASPDPVRVGDDLTYTLTIVNCMPGPATGVTLTDTLPAGVTFISASSTQGTCPRPGGAEDRVTCDIGTVAEEDRATVTIVVRPSEAGPLTNTASVGANEPDPDPGDNTDTVTTRALTLADLSVTKTAMPSSVNVVPGTLEFRLAVRNDGPQLANGVTVTDTLPAGSILLSVTPSRGTCGGTAIVTCQFGTLASGEAATVDVAVIVRVGKQIPNTARVTGRDVEDPNAANNVAETVTPCPPCAEFAIDRIEVTQAVQFLGDPAIPDNSVPLVRGKTTLVRVYLKNPIVPGVAFEDITGELSTFVCGQSAPIRPTFPNGQLGPESIRPVNSPTYPEDTAPSDYPDAGNRSLSDQRISLRRTLNFLLPNTYMRGCTDLQVTVSSPGSPGTATRKITDLRFETVPPALVRVYNVRTSGFRPSPLDRTLLSLWLLRAYPISDLIWEEDDIIAPPTPDVGPVPTFCAELNNRLWLTKLLNMHGGGEDVRFKYYGMLNSREADEEPPGIGFRRGTSLGSAVGVSCGPTGVADGSWSWDTDGIYGDWYGAHEIGHSYGLDHVLSRDGSQERAGCPPLFDCFEDDYPHPEGRISPLTGGCVVRSVDLPQVCGSLWGVDLRFAGDRSAVPPDWFDFMSYGHPGQWPSDFTYRKLRDILIRNGPPGADSILVVQNGAPGPGERSEHVAVTGLVDLTNGTAELDAVYRLPAMLPVRERVPGPYAVRLLDGAGAVLAEFPFAVDPLLENLASEGGHRASFVELVPYDPRTAGIAIVESGEVLAERTVTTNAPVVTMQAPLGGGTLDGTSVRVEWDASDADGDPLTFDLFFSADGGTTWALKAAAVTAQHADVDLTRLRGTTQGLFLVIANDGVNTGRAVTAAPFAVPEKPPEVVLSRTGPMSVEADEIVGLSGVAFDPEDGLLDEDALEWRSDQDGVLATGSVLMTGLLTPGTHRLTLTGTDSDGTEASASLTAVVGAASDDTPPTTSAAPSPPPNPAGWNNTDVTVTLTAADDEGGTGVKEIGYTLSGAQTEAARVGGESATVTISAEGVTTLAYAAVDNAGNEEETRTLTLRLDRTPPDVTATRGPEPNAFGWNASDVTARFEASDVLSGIDGQNGVEVVVAGEGEGQSVTRSFVDRAGNAASATVSSINIDKTPPAISGSRTPGPNAAGWNDEPVTVTFACSDALSGIESCGPSPQSVAGEGLGQEQTGTAFDRAGNAAAAMVGPINIDLTPPALSCDPRPRLLWPPNHRLVPVSLSVEIDDALSGEAGFLLLHVLSSESDNAPGSGDGNTVRDIRGFVVGTPDTSGLLRAERSATGPGRNYSLTYRGADLAGNAGVCTAKVRVPHELPRARLR